MDDFKFGILGCGFISGIHADAIKNIPGAVIAGAFDVHTPSKDAFCKAHGVRAFESSEEMLLSDADAICICLPSGLHFDAAMECIRHKKHIVLEKPMALTSKQAENIICAAEENGVNVTVISQLRYSPAVKEVKRMIDDGKLGTITLGNAIMEYRRSPEYYQNSSWRGTWEMDGGGALMNQGIHGVDILQYLMGKVVSVFAYAKTLVHNIETEDTLTAVLEYENGAIGSVVATTSVAPGYKRNIEICGSKGSLKLCEDTIAVCDVEGEEHHRFPGKRTSHAEAHPGGIDSSLHAEQLRDFISCVKKGVSPWISGKEGKKAVDIICAIYESAQTGKKIYLK